LVILLSMSWTTACGRTVENYCKTFYGEGEKLGQRYEGLNVDADPMTAVFAILGGIYHFVRYV
jgi:hypothetical protein